MVKIALIGAGFLVALVGSPELAAGQMSGGGGGGGGHKGGGGGKSGGKQVEVPDSTGIVPRPAVKSGCGAWDVRVGENGVATVTPVTTNSVDEPITTRCGPVQPTVAGSAVFNAASRIVRIPLALENLGIDRLHPPAALVGSVGSLIPVGRRPSATVLQFVGADSTAPDSVTRRGPETYWFFDKLLLTPGVPPLTAEDGATVLAPGATSLPHVVAVQMAPGVSAFRLNLSAMGTYVFTVPAQPATHLSMEEMEDSRAPDNVITGDPHFPGRVVRNKLWVLFRHDATEEQREAAIDLVDGVVIGGMTRRNDRYYYVRFAANPDSGAVPLGRAIRALAALPQVQDVQADQLATNGLN